MLWDGDDSEGMSLADQLQQRLIEIALMEAPDREPATKTLVKDCKEAGYDQTLKDLRAMRDKLVKEMEVRRAEELRAAGIADACSLIEEKFFVLRAGGKVRIGEWTTDTEGNPEMSLINRWDFLTLTENQFIGEGDDKVNAGEAWLKSPSRKTYTSIELDPTGSSGPEVLNLWRGYGCEPKDGTCDPILDHIGEIICNGDIELNNYLLDWIALKLQDPLRVMGTMPVLQGEPGVGKGVFAEELLMPIFGAHGYVLGDANLLTRNFNRHLMGKCFLFADEAIFAGDAAAAQKLKRIITAPTLNIEPKGVDAFRVKSHLGIIAAGNQAHIVNIDHNDRRVVVLPVNPKHARARAYFDPLRHHIANGGREAFLAKMLARDVLTFDPMHDLPITQATIDQRVYSLEGVARWWNEEVIESDSLPFFILSGNEAFWPKNTQTHRRQDWTGTVRISRAQVYKAFEDWFLKHGGKGRMPSHRRFWAELRACAACVLPADGDGNDRKVEFEDFDSQIKAMAAYNGSRTRGV